MVGGDVWESVVFGLVSGLIGSFCVVIDPGSCAVFVMTPVASDTEGGGGAGVVTLGSESVKAFVVEVVDLDVADFAGFGLFGLFGGGGKWDGLAGALDDDFRALAEEELDSEVKAGDIIYEGVGLFFAELDVWGLVAHGAEGIVAVDGEAEAAGEFGGLAVGAEVGVDVSLAGLVAVDAGQAKDAVGDDGGFEAYRGSAFVVAGDIADELGEGGMFEKFEDGRWVETAGEIDESFELAGVDFDAVISAIVDVGGELAVFCEVGVTVGLESVAHETDIGAAGGIEAGFFRDGAVGDGVEEVEF